MFTFGSRSKEALKGVHPNLVLVVSRGLLYSPIDFMITEGVRSLERQIELRDKGFSETIRSKHLVQPDGYAHAIDLMAVGDLDQDGDVDAQDKALTWSHDLYRDIANAMKKAAGEVGVSIRWGGDFKLRNGKPFFDGPHFEVTQW